MAQQIERNQDATVYVGNLDERCTETLVWELMLQAGPVGTLPSVGKSLQTTWWLIILLFARACYSQCSPA